MVARLLFVVVALFGLAVAANAQSLALKTDAKLSMQDRVRVEKAMEALLRACPILAREWGTAFTERRVELGSRSFGETRWAERFGVHEEIIVTLVFNPTHRWRKEMGEDANFVLLGRGQPGAIISTTYAEVFCGQKLTGFFDTWGEPLVRYRIEALKDLLR